MRMQNRAKKGGVCPTVKCGGGKLPGSKGKETAKLWTIRKSEKKKGCEY